MGRNLAEAVLMLLTPVTRDVTPEAAFRFISGKDVLWYNELYDVMS